jgi:hypothetical protein
MSGNSTRHDAYLGYLDREMSIMGILSTFSVALAALAIERVGSAQDRTVFRTVWDQSAIYVLVGSASALVGAAFFYKQRSLLAWYYGQITLCDALSTKAEDEIRKRLTDADAWDTWIPYHNAFGFLSFAFWPYSVALMRQVLPGLQGVSWAWTLVLPLLGLVVLLCVRAFVFWRYRLEDEPFAAFLRPMRR